MSESCGRRVSRLLFLGILHLSEITKSTSGQQSGKFSGSGLRSTSGGFLFNMC